MGFPDPARMIVVRSESLEHRPRRDRTASELRLRPRLPFLPWTHIDTRSSPTPPKITHTTYPNQFDLMKHYLFICSQNRLRSPTAENIFSIENKIETLSAGVDRDAETIVSEEEILWADAIFVMENRHKALLKQRFAKIISNKKIVVLNIPDEFAYMDPQLITILKKKMSAFL